MEKEISLARLQMAIRRCISTCNLYIAKAEKVKQIQGLNEEAFNDILQKLIEIESSLNG